MRLFRRIFLTIFLTLFGLGVGLAVGAILMRRVDRAAYRVSPEGLAEQAGRAAAAASHRMKRAVAAGREAADEKEAELRERFRIPSIQEAATIEETPGRSSTPPRRG